MLDPRRSLNEYLLNEFGMDSGVNTPQASENWPFELREVGQAPGLIAFEFDDDEPYFALAGHTLSFLPKAGMAFEDLLLQNAGSKWIGASLPVDMSTSIVADEAVPSTLERRRSLEELGVSIFPGQRFEILEGLYLRAERRYLALLRAEGESDAVAVGLPFMAAQVVGFPEASSWRRLAWAVGRWIRTSQAPSAR